MKASAFTARLMYSFPLGNLPSIHIGAGGVLENFRGSTDAGAGTYQFGANGLVGFNLGFGGVALRVDGLVNYLPSDGGKFDFGAQAGLQLSPDLRDLMGGGATGNPVMWAPYQWWDQLDAPLPGTVELGGFAQWTWFDDNAGRGPTGSMPKDGLGYGGRVGVFLSDPRWELEGDGYYSPQDNVGPPCCGVNQVTKVNAHAFATRLNYNFPIRLMGRQSQFILGAGGTRTSYKFKRATGPDSYTYNFGASGLAGLRLAVANRTALRLDGVIDYMPNHNPSANMNMSCSCRPELPVRWCASGGYVHVRRSREHSSFEPELRCAAAAATATATAADLPVQLEHPGNGSGLRGSSGRSGRHDQDHWPDLLRLRQVDDQTGCGCNTRCEDPVAAG